MVSACRHPKTCTRGDITRSQARQQRPTTFLAALAACELKFDFDFYVPIGLQAETHTID